MQELGKLCRNSRPALRDVPLCPPDPPRAEESSDGRARALEPWWPQQCPGQAGTAHLLLQGMEQHSRLQELGASLGPQRMGLCEPQHSLNADAFDPIT